MKKLILLILLLTYIPLFGQSLYGQYSIYNPYGNVVNIWGSKTKTVSRNWDTDALTYFAAMSVQLPDSVKFKVDDFYKALKSGYCISNSDTTKLSDTTYYQRFEEIQFYANGSSQAGLLGMKRYKDAVAVNSPNFLTWGGFQSDGLTSYVRTNFNPATDKICSSQNFVSMWLFTKGASENGFHGGNNASTDFSLLPNYGGNYQFRLNNGGNGGTAGATDGLSFGSRYNSGSLVGARNSKMFYLLSGYPSASIPSIELYVCANNNNNGGANRFSGTRVALWAIGGSFRRADYIAIKVIIETLLAGVGVTE